MVRVLAIQGAVTNLCMTIAGGLGMTRQVTYTTREPIDGEEDGVEYHFIKPVYFTKLMVEGFFATVNIFEGNHYGIPRYIEAVEEPTSVFVVPENIPYLKKIYGKDCLAVGVIMAWDYVERTVRSNRLQGISMEEYKQNHTDQLTKLDKCDLILNVSDLNHEQVARFIGNINGLVIQKGW